MGRGRPGAYTRVRIVQGRWPGSVQPREDTWTGVAGAWSLCAGCFGG